jgi:hypothetical protein
MGFISEDDRIARKAIEKQIAAERQSAKERAEANMPSILAKLRVSVSKAFLDIESDGQVYEASASFIDPDPIIIQYKEVTMNRILELIQVVQPETYDLKLQPHGENEEQYEFVVRFRPPLK